MRKVSDSDFCIARKRRGRGFSYHDENGNIITSRSLRRCFAKLAIPPMWDDVMICKWRDGHIQAIGRDQKGRKQYIYHSEWERQQQAEKFKRLYLFGKRLPAVRKKCLQEITTKGWHREKILALLVLVLDESGIRIGNKHYAVENNSFGLSTLRRKHLQVEDGTVIFRFNGKSGVEQEVEIDNTELIQIIRKCAQLPGYELFRYQTSQGAWHTVDSEEINEWIHLLAGDNFSSKDFRTWVATRLAIELYDQAKSMQQKKPSSRLHNLLVKLVAEKLGNTPTVCRNYYIHPVILEQIRKQSVPEMWRFKQPNSQHQFNVAEKVVMKMLKLCNTNHAS